MPIRGRAVQPMPQEDRLGGHPGVPNQRGDERDRTEVDGYPDRPVAQPV